jgi:hypothetical protein
VLNKAHTAAVRRIAARYGVDLDGADPTKPSYGQADRAALLLQSDSGTIAVETSATLESSISHLKVIAGRRYIAVTNKETLAEAQRLVIGSGIGVMDSRGEIVVEAAN